MLTPPWDIRYYPSRIKAIALLPRRVRFVLGAEWLRTFAPEYAYVAETAIAHALGRSCTLDIPLLSDDGANLADAVLRCVLRYHSEAADCVRLALLSDECAHLAVAINLLCDNDEWVVAQTMYEAAFGGPFVPEWRTSDVVALGNAIVETRDFNICPILADALQDAGMSDERVLSRLRVGQCALSDWAIWNIMQLGD